MNSKIALLSVMLVFMVLAVPSVYAEEGVQDNGNVENGAEDELVDVGSASVDNGAESTSSEEAVATGTPMQVRENAQAQVKNAGDAVVTARETVRVRAQEMRDNVVAAHQEAKQKYQAAKVKYQEKKQIWVEAKQNYRENKTPENFKKAREGVKRYMDNAGSRLLRYIDVLRSRAENLHGVSDEDKANIIAELDLLTENVEALQAEIADVNSGEEIQGVAEKVRNQWNEVRAQGKKLTGLLLAAKISWAIEKSEKVSERFSERIENMNQNGLDTAELETDLSIFNSEIELAKEKYWAAKGKFSEIESVEESTQAFQEGHEFVKEANQHLKEMYSQLREMFQKTMQEGKPKPETGEDSDGEEPEEIEPAEGEELEGDDEE